MTWHTIKPGNTGGGRQRMTPAGKLYESGQLTINAAENYLRRMGHTAPSQQASVAAECGGIGGGDIQCRWDKLVESSERLAEVAQSPESEGLGTILLGTLALVVGGGWVCWKWMLR